MTCRHNQRGFSIVAAIFVLVVLALLGAFMVTIGQLGQATATYAMQGARAYHAAQSGIEWGIYSALNNRVATCGAAPSTPTSNPLNLTAPGLNGFSVTIVCSYTQHQEAGNPNVLVFVITSTATFGTFGSPDYFSRTVQVTVTDAP